jgi:hypothetical protein
MQWMILRVKDSHWWAIFVLTKGFSLHKALLWLVAMQLLPVNIASLLSCYELPSLEYTIVRHVRFLLDFLTIAVIYCGTTYLVAVLCKVPLKNVYAPSSRP